MLAGLTGCLLPILPGPPLSFIGILFLHFRSYGEFSLRFLAGFGAAAALVTLLDSLLPLWDTKRFGGSRRGIVGATIGLLTGLFFLPPFGMIVFPFVGALLGELSTGKEVFLAVRSSMGSFAGFLVGTLLKLSVAGLILYFFITELILKIK